MGVGSLVLQRRLIGFPLLYESDCPLLNNVTHSVNLSVTWGITVFVSFWHFLAFFSKHHLFICLILYLASLLRTVCPLNMNINFEFFKAIQLLITLHDAMVHILPGNSGITAHVWSEIGNLFSFSP